MQPLTERGQQIVNDLAQRHGFSTEAVTVMLGAVANGYGNQAQFNHPEFGGMGQWSSGGMVMIGDMFNNYLKGRVSALCQELSGLVQGQTLFAMPAQSQSQNQGGWQNQYPVGGQQQIPGGGYQSQGGGYQSQGGGGSSLFVGGGNWWPGDLGQAASQGAQNNMRYAYFPNTHRLAIDVNGQVSVYDTGNHQIGGFGQQQSGDQSLSFTSQFGLVRVGDLPIVSGNALSPAAPSFVASAAPSLNNTAPPVSSLSASVDFGTVAAPSRNCPSSSGGFPANEIFGLIEKLADLRAKGILTDAEFETKKSELLSRL